LYYGVKKQKQKLRWEEKEIEVDVTEEVEKEISAQIYENYL